MLIETGTTGVPPIVNVNVLSIFFGNPEPLITNLAPPSGDAEVGDTEVIARLIVVPVTPASTNEYPIL